MATKLVKFSEFNVKVDNWDNYIVRLKYCFEANGIDVDSVKRANFCTVCGPQTFETLLALITPKKSNEVSFDEIVDILTKHFSPKPNEISTSYKFYKRDQGKDETSSEYIAQLRKISTNCNFPNLERMLRDRLVCGMSDRALQYELLKRDRLEYADVVDAMLSAESAGRDARMMHAAPPPPAAPAPLAPPPEHAAPACEPMDVNALRPQPILRLCYRCGDRHGGECRFINAICHYCKKKGHIEKICTAKKKNTTRKLNYADDNTDESMNGIYSVAGARTRVPAYEVRVELDGVPVAMEVDSGAAFSLVNERTWARLPERAAPRPLRTKLRTWNDSVKSGKNKF